MASIPADTTFKQANDTFEGLERRTIDSLKSLIEITGEMNIDFQDIEAFIRNHPGPLCLYTLKGESFDEPLKYFMSEPYLPADLTDGKQLLVNIGYARDVDMNAYRQINLRLHDLFSKADLFKIGTYYLDEPGEHFHITLMVNGLNDPIEVPDGYKKQSGYQWFQRKVKRFAEKSKRRFR